MAIPLLPPSPVGFPHPDQALTDPDGLLAAGGDLSAEWLIEAYARGIFPWFEHDDDHILWWSPSERAVLIPGKMRVTRSLAKRIRNGGFIVKLDTAFDQTIDACRTAYRRGAGTWITQEMQNAYLELHHRGVAHSFETWRDDQLVGGLYGVSLGNIFCGESMFSLEPDASKVAFYAMQNLLESWQYGLIDCQMMNAHLAQLGVSAISRVNFLGILENNNLEQTRVGNWQTWSSSANLLDHAE